MFVRSPPDAGRPGGHGGPSGHGGHNGHGGPRPTRRTPPDAGGHGGPSGRGSRWAISPFGAMAVVGLCFTIFVPAFIALSDGYMLLILWASYRPDPKQAARE